MNSYTYIRQNALINPSRSRWLSPLSPTQSAFNIIHRTLNMFHKKPEMKISAGALSTTLGIWLMLVFSPAAAAQDGSSPGAAGASREITIEVAGNELAAPVNFLVLGDSGKANLALVRISIDGSQLWSRRSDAAVEIPGTVHWFDDEASGWLSIDLSGVRQQLQPQSTLAVVVTLPQSEAAPSQVTVFQAGERPPGPEARLQKIKDVTIELN